MEDDVIQSGQPAAAIRVAIISEHALARAGIAQAVCSQPGMQVTGQYDSCRTALPHVMKMPPDAVVVELSPGGGDVLDAISRCHAAFPEIAHVVISQTKDHELAERAIRAGARAFIFKGAGPASLASAIRDAVAGELHVCRCIASPMLQKALYGKSGHKTKHPDLALLSAREFQVFQLLGSGWDNARIARELGISIKTLNAHKEHMKDKLGLSTTTVLMNAATEWQVRGGVANA